MNFLNPVQLQKVHTRWLSSYTAQTSQKLLDFKKLAEEVAPAMPMENTNTLDIRAIKYAFDVDINAPKEKVWSLLNDDSSSWFPNTYHSSPDTKGYIMEPHVGGRFYEDYGNGNGKMMGFVIGYEAGHRVQLQGSVTPDMGGPATTLLSMTLEEDGDGCRLKIDDSMFGHFPDELAQNREWAFRELFGNYLKTAAEA